MGSKSSKTLGAQSQSVSPVKLQDCPEECDEKIRAAKFALRTTDLSGWNSLITSGSGGDGTSTNSTVLKRLQHWSLLVHFPRGNKTYLYEAGKNGDNGILQATRTENVDYKVFKKAEYMYFGTVETSPCKLLEIAKKVSSNDTPYNLTNNNCQTWLIAFLKLISPQLFQSFEAMLHNYTVKTTTTIAVHTSNVLSIATNIAALIFDKR